MTVPYDPAELHRPHPPDSPRCSSRPASTRTGASLFVQSHVRRARRAAPGSSTASPPFGELRRMTQFKDKCEGPGVGDAPVCFDYPVLMAADILLYDTDEVPGRRRPAPARRARPRRRDPLQPPLRRHVRRPEGHVPARSGARIMDLQHPTAKMSKSVDSPQGTILVLDSPDGDHQEDQVGRHRLRHRGALRPRREARASRTCSRSTPSSTGRTVPDVGGRVRRVAATARSRPPSPTPGRVPPPGPGALRRSSPPIPGEVDRLLALGAEKAAAIAEPVLARARDAAGLLPPPVRRRR